MRYNENAETVRNRDIMPVYVYQCETCGVTFERRQRMLEEPLTACPECRGRVHRVIQPVGIVFKGSGFYVTDNRSPSSTALPGSKSDEKASLSTEDQGADSTSKAEKTEQASKTEKTDKASSASD